VSALLPGQFDRPAAARSRALTALLGLVLLVGAVASTVQSGRETALDELDHSLSSEAGSTARALQEYFERV
jgi:hypothetical protein